MKKNVLVVTACAVIGVVLGVLASALGAPVHVSLPLVVGCMAGGLAVVALAHR